MATSFRLNPEHMQKLQYLADRLHKSKAQVVKEAIEMFYDAQAKQSKRSALDLLHDARFSPLDERLECDAADEDGQRRIIRAKISKKNRD
jgi:CHAD domain-containing protein